MHRNALIFKRQFFLRIAKNRLVDPSEIRALDLKHESQQSAISSLSATISIDWSIFAIGGAKGHPCSREKYRHRPVVSTGSSSASLSGRSAQVCCGTPLPY
jgi:hypothetical protein